MTRKTLTKKQKNERKDHKYLKSTLGWRSKPTSERRSAHDESESEAPEGFQIEDPVRTLIQDGFERIQHFQGNLAQAMDEGLEGETHHVLSKYLNLKLGDYTSEIEELQKKEFVIRERDAGGVYVEKVVTVAEAYQQRLEEQGRVGPVERRIYDPYTGKITRRIDGTDDPSRIGSKFADDEPHILALREEARHMENENPTARRGEEGKRGRKDSMSLAPHDPEEVPWKDDTDLDPFGQGVQIVETRTSEGKLKTFWLQEKPIYGAKVTDEGYVIEEIVGREQVARPFSDLIIPEKIEVRRWQRNWQSGELENIKISGWDVLDDEERIIPGLSAYSFPDLWDFMKEIQRRVDELEDAKVVGHGKYPWGIPFVKVRVKIPEELLHAAGMLLAVEKYKKATWFAFEVVGPAVPALRDELDKECRKLRHTLPEKGYIYKPEVLRAIQLQVREHKERKRWSQEQWQQFAPQASTIRADPALAERNECCELCGRKIDRRRIEAFKDRIKDAVDLESIARLERCMRRCTRNRTVDGQVKLTYCDGTDLEHANVSAK